jgi:hypothetical protein
VSTRAKAYGIAAFALMLGGVGGALIARSALPLTLTALGVVVELVHTYTKEHR